MVIGGIAVIARGVSRFTADIDACVLGDAITPERLAAILARHEIEPREPDAIAFARQSLVLLVRHRPTRIELDVSFGWSAFEQAALSEATPVKYGRVVVPIAGVADLVVYKVIAARGKDLDDVASLLALYPKLDLAAIRRRVAELAELADEPAYLETLAKLLSARRAATRAHRTRKPANRRK